MENISKSSRNIKIRMKFEHLNKTGILKSFNKLTPKLVQMLRLFIFADIPIKEIADSTKLSYGCIRDLKCGKTWKNLPYYPPIFNDFLNENETAIVDDFSTKNSFKIIYVYFVDEFLEKNQGIIAIADTPDIVQRGFESFEQAKQWLQKRIPNEFVLMTENDYQKMKNSELEEYSKKESKEASLTNEVKDMQK